jgi:hypothetical protein
MSRYWPSHEGQRVRELGTGTRSSIPLPTQEQSFVVMTSIDRFEPRAAKSTTRKMWRQARHRECPSNWGSPWFAQGEACQVTLALKWPSRRLQARQVNIRVVGKPSSPTCDPFNGWSARQPETACQSPRQCGYGFSETGHSPAAVTGLESITNATGTYRPQKPPPRVHLTKTLVTGTKEEIATVARPVVTNRR